jgi:3-phytase/alkaline phosphatase D
MSEVDSIRFATFNASLNRNSEGQLITDLSTPNNTQAKTVAEIIQRNNPDVLLVNEFDFDAGGEAAQLFQENYLSVGQNGANPVEYPYFYVAPSNTGVASGFDLNNNGTVVTTPGAPGYGEDALGFGNFPGQYGMVIYSKYPIDTENIRTFQNFLWKDMPGALLPDAPNTPEANDWYSPEELEVFRLSSKSHWDVPIEVNGETIHVLASHPTPPTFDGPEDRNGTRNHDEIRFWSDYITPGEGSYIYDDAGDYGGLAPGSRFVIMGDQNADPNDGDSVDNAILQLLDNPLINTSITPSSEGGSEQAALQGGANATHITDPAFDTADFADGAPGNLRVDYVLPSQNLEITDAAVFWPESTEPQFPLVGTFNPSTPGGFPSSDHRLVRVDVTSEASTSDFNRQTVSDVEFLGEVTFPTGFTFEGTQVGGLSGIAYDRFNNVFYSISDDRSQFNPARFYTLNIDLSDGSLDDGDVTFEDVTTITDENGQPFALNSLDPEGIAFTERGTLFISSEGERSTNRLIDPFVNEFSLQGKQFNELPVPDKFNPAGVGENDPGIRNNLAFESLTISPDQRFLFTATENALVQDGPAATLTNGSPSRILQYDLQTGEAVGEFLYITDPVADAPNPTGSFSTNGLVELLALDNNGTFLSLERSFSTGVGNSVKLYQTSILGATDISDLDSVNPAEVDAVAQKRLLLDLADLGITLDNLEGLALGPTLEDGRQSLIVVADNNFSSTQFTQVLSFALDIDTIAGASPIVGDDENNNLFGDNGNDTIQGRGGNDQIFGSEGVNTLFGDSGDDVIFGGSQADSITGGTGDDTIFASEGNNTVFGGAGNDTIYSGSGNDRIDAGKGNDTIWLGGGRDIVVLAKGNGIDTINNFQPCQTQIGLSGGLRFNDLTITQGDGATLISVGNEVLASLSWVQASSISASNFVTV